MKTAPTLPDFEDLPDTLSPEELLAGGIPCNAAGSSDPDVDPRLRGCVADATHFDDVGPWCETHRRSDVGVAESRVSRTGLDHSPPTCRVCRNPVIGNQPHNGCAAYLAVRALPGKRYLGGLLRGPTEPEATPLPWDATESLRLTAEAESGLRRVRPRAVTRTIPPAPPSDPTKLSALRLFEEVNAGRLTAEEAGAVMADRQRREDFWRMGRDVGFIVACAIVGTATGGLIVEIAGAIVGLRP